jgi:hypothetical protein
MKLPRYIAPIHFVGVGAIGTVGLRRFRPVDVIDAVDWLAELVVRITGVEGRER